MTPTTPTTRRPRTAREEDRFARALICTYIAVILGIGVSSFLIGYFA